MDTFVLPHASVEQACHLVLEAYTAFKGVESFWADLKVSKRTDKYPALSYGSVTVLSHMAELGLLPSDGVFAVLPQINKALNPAMHAMFLDEFDEVGIQSLHDYRFLDRALTAGLHLPPLTYDLITKTFNPATFTRAVTREPSVEAWEEPPVRSLFTTLPPVVTVEHTETPIELQTHKSVQLYKLIDASEIVAVKTTANYVQVSIKPCGLLCLAPSDPKHDSPLHYGTVSSTIPDQTVCLLLIIHLHTYIIY